MTAKQEKIFFEIHKDIPREGPGSFESTKRAFQLLTGLPEQPVILDVGCGPGKQTLDLAKITKGKMWFEDKRRFLYSKLKKFTIRFTKDNMGFYKEKF